MAEVVSKPLDWFRPDPDQPRKVFDIEELRHLASTLEVKQLVPLLAKPCGTIVDGERRWRAAMLEKKPETLDVIIVTETLTTAQQQDMQLITTLQRSTLSDYEQFVAFTRWFELNVGGTAKMLAQRVGKNASMLTRIMSLSGGIEEVKKAAEAGKLSASEWYPICRLEPEAQLGLLNLKLSGTVSRDQLEQHARKQKNGNGQAASVKLDKVNIAMPGAKVAITGKDLNMAALVELLSETLKHARKAAETYDVKTFMKMMADQAKAGG